MPTPARVLLVDDEQNIMMTVKICLESIGLHVDAFSDPLAALESLKKVDYDIGFYDLKMQGMSGMQLLKETRVHSPSTTVVMMTAHGSVESAVEAMKLGAFDYLQKPFEFSELKLFAEKVMEHHRLQSEVRLLREELKKRGGSGEIITRNSAVQALVDLATKVAASTITVLIEGESGTGKELFARHIHRMSERVEGPFIQVNCAALAPTLLESELFGHVKGAFTGALRDRQGRFEVADGGTIFLDEVGELDQAMQAKLLRVLQSREFERVGESTTRKTDVRVIAATNRNLEEEVAQGVFREDLFYRLNPVRIKLPPLRERTEDIPLLLEHFLAKRKIAANLSTEVLSALSKYSWKGNIRELENVIERAVLLSGGAEVQIHHLPEEFQTLAETGKQLLSLEETERAHIIKVLRLAKDLDEAASMLAIDPATLWRKRKKYNL